MARKSRNHTTKKSTQQPLRVVELFAGVGGFRLGLSGREESKKHEFTTVWFNQWEPGTKKQHAHEVYVNRFAPRGGEVREYTNTDIAEAIKAAKAGEFTIPDHDVLVGGFPCQDYSVARTLSQASGLIGKKGVLWWEIRNILEHKQKEGAPVKYVFLENVDRLLKSPTKRRGRDFAIMLATLSDLGYAVEWRIVNAADYGMPQRRRRIFIVGYHNSSPLYGNLQDHGPQDILLEKGVIASALPVTQKGVRIEAGRLEGSAADLTEKFNMDDPDTSPFYSAGMLRGRDFHTVAISAKYDGPVTTLGDILLPEKQVAAEYFINGDMKGWKYLKGAKKEKRRAASGFEFFYTEGPMVFPDPLNKPSRTIITGEGGPTPSRFKHVVKTKSGKHRRLTPIELERLCMFPDKHTELAGVSDVRRAFFMGNALVVGVIDKIGRSLYKMHTDSNKGGSNTSKRPVPSPLGLKPTRPNRHHAPAKSS